MSSSSSAKPRLIVSSATAAANERQRSEPWIADTLIVKDQGFAAGSILSMTCALYIPPSSTLPSIANTHSIPPFGAE